MTTGKFKLVIRSPSGQSTICGEMTDHQHGEICRILSPDYRAQLSSQGGEAVEVVAVAFITRAEKSGPKIAITLKKEDAEKQHKNWLSMSKIITTEPLMTVAQHQRILTAATHPADQVAEPDAELVELLKGLVEIAGRKKRGRPGSPNHSHSIPGIWDSDNGDLAGKPCAECALYDMAVARIAALQH